MTATAILAKETKICGIYLIRHIESGKVYIGQSRNVPARWKMHSYGYGKGRIARAIKKHGFDAFSKDLIEECPASDLNNREQHWISFHNSMAPNGFNLTTGGECCEKSPESIEKTAKFHRGKKRSQETCARIGAAKVGMKHSDEAKKKMSLAGIGRPKSDETREKLRVSSTGRMHSEETKENLKVIHKEIGARPDVKLKRSISAKARTDRTPLSEEHKEKIRAANVGRVISSEWRAKIAATLTGSKLTPDSIAKREATNKARRDALRSPLELTGEFKKCILCGDIKPIFDFYTQKRSADGRDGCCKACSLARTRRYKEGKK